MRPLRKILRIVAVAALLATGGQHVVELVHRLAVEHARCAEHGEVVHVEKGFAKSSPASVTRGARESRELAHEHCPVVWLAELTSAVSDPCTESEIVVHAAQRSAPIASPHPARPVLIAAPKTSPPSEPA
jgi:hypothetical protein